MLGKPTRDELLIISILSIVLVIITPFVQLNILRIIIGLPVALFFPGYTLLAAMFPRKSTFDSMERVALSFGLSILVVAFIGLILNYTPLGVTLYPVLGFTTLFIIVCSVVASFRRRKLSAEERFSVSFRFNPTKLAGIDRMGRVLSIVILLTIAAFVGTLSFVISHPDVGERFTRFYILDIEGNNENYPQELTVGEEGEVIVGIVNEERQVMSYRFEVTIDGEIDTEVDEIVLAHQEKWEKEIGFTLVRVGENQKVEFLLYKSAESEPYLRTYLWIDVKE